MLACDRWGRTSPMGTQDPSCGCAMCQAGRYDTLPKSSKAKAKRATALRNLDRTIKASL